MIGSRPLRLFRRRAASLAEYGVLAALVATAALGAVVLLGQRTSDLTDHTGEVLAGNAAPPGQPSGAPLQGILPGELVWSPGDLAFVLSPAMPARSASVTLINVGGGRSLPFSSPQISGPGAVAFSILATDCPDSLGAGESCSISIEASALSNGTHAATLAAPGVPGGVSLQAEAAGFEPILSWSAPAPLSIDGTPGPDPLPRAASTALTLTNVGHAVAPGIAPTLLSQAGAAFTLSHDCPPILAIGQACTAIVTAEAAANSPLSATLTSGGTGPTIPIEITVSGLASGFAPAWAWSGGGALTLTSPASNPATVEQTFTLTNTGTLAGTPATPTVSGSGPGYGFTLVSHTCGSSLAPGQVCTATVRATYTDNVASAAGGLAGPATQPLAGSASGFAPAWAFDASPAGTFSISSPATTQALTFTLRNVGTLAGAIPARTLSGPNAADYAITGGTCASQTLSPNATCTVQVTFSAANNVSGRTATLAAGAATKPLTGSASGFVPNLTLALQTANISSRSVYAGGGDNDSSYTEYFIIGTLRLRNIGTAPATITGYTVSGPRLWDRNTCPPINSSLAPGAVCDITFESYPLSTSYTYSCGQTISFGLSANVSAVGIPSASYSGTVSASQSNCNESGGEGVNP